MIVLALLGVLSAWLYLAILSAKAYLAFRYAASQPETVPGHESVTVLQPVLGGDPLLGVLLEANLHNTPADARFVWLIDEVDQAGRDAAGPIAQDPAFQDRVEIILCPPCPAGINPKLFKLNRALPQVVTDYVAILDDDTTVPRGLLQRAVGALSTADLYTGLPRYAPGQTFWSDLVSQFVNNNSAMTYLSLLNWTGPLTVNGMFYVMRTERLRSFGGFEPIIDRLCDDYALARLLLEKGGRIRQGTASPLLRTSVSGRAHYIELMHRWFVFANVLVRDQRPAIQLLLAVWLGLPPLLLWGSLLALAGKGPGALVLLVTLVLRHVILRLLNRRVFPDDPPALSWWRSPLSEILQPLHLAHALLSPVIQWRSRTIRVGSRGSFEVVENPSDLPEPGGGRS